MGVPMRDWLIMVLLSLDVTGCAAASAELLCCCSSPSCSACCLPWSLMIEQRRTRSSYMYVYGRSGQTFLEDLTDRRAFTAGACRPTGRRQVATSTLSRLGGQGGGGRRVQRLEEHYLKRIRDTRPADDWQRRVQQRRDSTAQQTAHNAVRPRNAAQFRATPQASDGGWPILRT